MGSIKEVKVLLRMTVHEPDEGMGSLWVLDRPMSLDSLGELLDEMLSDAPLFEQVETYDTREDYNAQSLHYTLSGLLPSTRVRLFGTRLPNDFQNFGWARIPNLTFESGEFKGLRFATNFQRYPLEEVFKRRGGPYRRKIRKFGRSSA